MKSKFQCTVPIKYHEAPRSALCLKLTADHWRRAFAWAQRFSIADEPNPKADRSSFEN